MKRNLFLLSALALMVAGGVFWSCQKEEMLVNPEGVMLKNASIELPDCDADCITEEIIYDGVVFKGKIDNPSYTETGTIQVYNTIDHLIVKVQLDEEVVTGIFVKINDIDYFYDKEGDPITTDYVTTSTPDKQGKISWLQLTLPLSENVACTEFDIEVTAKGEGTASVLYKQYQWCEDCSIRTETAFGGDNGVGVNEAGNWFYYFTAADGEAKIWAGQNEEIGTVKLNDGEISIELNGSWKLEDGEAEAVKVQGLNEEPTSRLTGKDYGYKGNNLIIEVEEFDYYMIHLDVEICE